MPKARNPIAIICSTCGSKDVSRDAWGDWNEADQQWELRAVFDHAHCHRCDRETSLKERPLR